MGDAEGEREEAGEDEQGEADGTEDLARAVETGFSGGLEALVQDFALFGEAVAALPGALFVLERSYRGFLKLRPYVSGFLRRRGW